MNNKFTATIVFEEDKLEIQDLRLQFKVTEKTMMHALLRAATQHPETLAAAIEESKGLTPKRGRKNKKTDTNEEVDQTTEAETTEEVAA